MITTPTPIPIPVHKHQYVHVLQPSSFYVLQLVACGGCDLLSQSLLYTQAITNSIAPSSHNDNAHNEDGLGGISDLLIQWTCRSIDSFISSDTTSGNGLSCQDKFAANFVCESIMLFLQEKRITFQSTALLLRVVGSLARYHPGNKARLGNLGLCEIIPHLYHTYTTELQTNGNSGDSSSISSSSSFSIPANAASELLATLGEVICWATGNLAYPNVENQLRLGRSGVCSIVAQVTTH